MPLNGFTICRSSDWGTYRVPGTMVSLTVRREVAPLLIGYAAEYHRLVEPLRSGWCWGAACRNVRGRSVPSFHSAGLAVDLNAPKHPLGVDPDRSLSRRQQATMRALARRYGLRLGIDYQNRPDGMHAEVILPRSQALELVRRLQRPSGLAAPKKSASVSRETSSARVATPRLAKLRWGASNSDVVLLQRQLARRGYSPGATDGAYGPRTRAAVARFQHAQGWSGRDADGLVGPLTLDRLF